MDSEVKEAIETILRYIDIYFNSYDDAEMWEVEKAVKLLIDTIHLQDEKYKSLEKENKKLNNIKEDYDRRKSMSNDLLKKQYYISKENVAHNYVSLYKYKQIKEELDKRNDVLNQVRALVWND